MPFVSQAEAALPSPILPINVPPRSVPTLLLPSTSYSSWVPAITLRTLPVPLPARDTPANGSAAFYLLCATYSPTLWISNISSIRGAPPQRSPARCVCSYIARSSSQPFYSRSQPLYSRSRTLHFCSCSRILLSCSRSRTLGSCWLLSSGSSGNGTGATRILSEGFRPILSASAAPPDHHRPVVRSKVPIFEDDSRPCVSEQVSYFLAAHHPYQSVPLFKYNYTGTSWNTAVAPGRVGVGGSLALQDSFHGASLVPVLMFAQLGSTRATFGIYPRLSRLFVQTFQCTMLR